MDVTLPTVLKRFWKHVRMKGIYQIQSLSIHKIQSFLKQILQNRGGAYRLSRHSQKSERKNSNETNIKNPDLNFLFRTPQIAIRNTQTAVGKPNSLKRTLRHLCALYSFRHLYRLLGHAYLAVRSAPLKLGAPREGLYLPSPMTLSSTIDMVIRVCHGHIFLIKLNLVIYREKKPAPTCPCVKGGQWDYKGKLIITNYNSSRGILGSLP